MSVRLGKLVLVVGASCAGKDTLIRWATGSLGPELPLRFEKLEITRPLTPADRHAPIDRASFESRRRSGYYVLHWDAHGVSYGVPGSARTALDSGISVVTVASRAAIDRGRALPWECHVLEIRAPFEVLKRRLKARGREAGEDLAERLSRSSQIAVLGANVHVIDNGGALTESGAAFNRVLAGLVAAPVEASA